MFLPLLLGFACSLGQEADRCGPGRARVAQVIDGDTIELAGGTRVRYLLADAPESTGGKRDCYGPEAARFNADLVDGREVDLKYDEQCEDRYGRLLAYVSVAGREVNQLLVERGFACALYIPPNGRDRKDQLELLESQARSEGRGMWSACEVISCD
ncbi:MAG: thermonuclease family protein [Deltaproteobacteria bacterium]|nr:thermonuclease family protein [Deltaproteobacteria bacterium]